MDDIFSLEYLRPFFSTKKAAMRFRKRIFDEAKVAGDVLQSDIVFDVEQILNETEAELVRIRREFGWRIPTDLSDDFLAKRAERWKGGTAIRRRLRREARKEARRLVT